MRLSSISVCLRVFHYALCVWRKKLLFAAPVQPLQQLRTGRVAETEYMRPDCHVADEMAGIYEDIVCAARHPRHFIVRCVSVKKDQEHCSAGH